MKQIPILFSTEMVLALLAGRKTKTRRVVTPQPIDNTEVDGNFFEGNHKGYVKVDGHPNWRQQFAHEFAPWNVGDQLYVRESYYQRGSWREVPDVKTKTGRMKWEFVPAEDGILFESPGEYRKGRHHKDPYTVAWHKRLGRFMPKRYARIWLEVVNVRVERLHDITENDAVNEGIATYTPLPELTFYENYSQDKRKDFIKGSEYGFDHGKQTHTAAVASFCTLWITLHGRDNWMANPWVWVVEFKVLKTTGKPTNL